MTPDSMQVRLRQARGAMSLAAAAERSGIPADRIRMYEEGERQAYGKTLRRLAQAYGVSVGELRGKTPSGAARSAAGGRSETQQARARRRRRRVTASEDGGAAFLIAH
jgi:transcriptional regulator with XRE-family HTH domain